MRYMIMLFRLDQELADLNLVGRVEDFHHFHSVGRSFAMQDMHVWQSASGGFAPGGAFSRPKNLASLVGKGRVLILL